jgi:nucleotide-binding universal stress UspA family protein
VLADVIQLGKLWDADYTFMQVIEPGRITGVPTEALWLPIDDSTVVEARTKATTYLGQLADRFSKPDLEIETVVAVEPHTASAILDFAEHSDIDLIALTTHGRGGLGKLVLGSVADKIMRGASVPVLLYRPRGA